MADETTYVGRTLHQVPTPAAVLDLAKLKVNCERMIAATRKLGLSWRAHIKTHKTTQLTRLQVGDGDTPVNLVVSTLVEAENIVPLLKEYQSKGRQVNVLYGFPLLASAVARLASVAAQLGSGSVGVLVDHPDQLPSLAALAAASGHPPLVFLKVDTGYRRAGVAPGSDACDDLVDALLAAEAAGSCLLHGLYSHASHSYGTRGDWQAMGLLETEFAGVHDVARRLRTKSPGHPLVLSAGATPTATAVQHPQLAVAGETPESAARTGPLGQLFDEIRADGFELEVHAGVYPTLDLQQLATHARDGSLLTYEDLALDVLVEVASLYPGRGAAGTAEALVNAGSLALGREPVQDKGTVPGRDYSGWGVVSAWNSGSPTPGPDFPAEHGGWQVGRISQEHGILVWEGARHDEVPLAVGQRLRISPNHACITGACFDRYLVVDSRDREDEIVDVWERWRGW